MHLCYRTVQFAVSNHASFIDAPFIDAPILGGKGVHGVTFERCHTKTVQHYLSALYLLAREPKPNRALMTIEYTITSAHQPQRALPLSDPKTNATQPVTDDYLYLHVGILQCNN